MPAVPQAPRQPSARGAGGAVQAGIEVGSRPSAQINATALEVLVEANPSTRISSLVIEVVYSVQKAQPAPPAGRRRPVVIVMG
jgi:hypothetical protein